MAPKLGKPDFSAPCPPPACPPSLAGGAPWARRPSYRLSRLGSGRRARGRRLDLPHPLKIPKRPLVNLASVTPRLWRTAFEWL